MIKWIVENWVEVTAALLGIIYLVLSIKRHISLWFFGLLTSALYIYVFFVSKFYADMALQWYYVFVSIYGWIHWRKGNVNVKELPVSSPDKKLMLVLLSSWILLWVVMSWFLAEFTDSTVPVGDGFTTAGSIVATWMLAQKIKEHWLFWVVIDFVSLVLYINKNLYPTSVLFLIYTTMAVVGYLQWNKVYKQNKVKLSFASLKLQKVRR